MFTFATPALRPAAHALPASTNAMSSDPAAAPTLEAAQEELLGIYFSRD